MAKRQGLNAKEMPTMKAMLESGKSVKVVSEWLQVDEAFVKEHAPKKVKKTKKKE